MNKLKWFGIILFLLAIGVVACTKIISKDLPEGTGGNEADALAQDMLNALNVSAWEQIRYLRWTFFGGSHHYHWDKQENIAIIEWKKNKVVMDLDQVDGLAMKDGVLVEGEDKKKLIDKAWSFWCNDSFWFCAPFKVFDPGVKRYVVEEEGKKGLKVSYESGGVTPGDSYIYWLGANNIPESWQMWTQVLPVQGVSNTWEDWIELPGGAMISSAHGGLGLSAKLTNIAGGMKLSDIDLSEDAFQLK